MLQHFVILSVAFISVLAQQQQQETEVKRVQVSVYYETLCPDSKAFIVNQLYPTLNGNLGKYVELKLIPYGKTKSNHNQGTNTYDFKCDHGPQECTGNKYHACAIKKIDGGKNSDGLGFNRHTLSFVKCLMEKVVDTGADTKFPISDCVIVSNVTNLSDIDNCEHHSEGADFLVNFGTETESLKPSLKTVPTIVFNGTYSDDDNTNAKSNFEALVCKYAGLSDCPEMPSSSQMCMGAFALILLSQTLIRLF